MGRACSGGQLDGMHVYTVEDANSCELGGGRIVSSGGDSGCAAANMASAPLSTAAGMGRGGGFDLAPLRRLRARGRDNPIVEAALSLNALAAPEIGRLIRSDQELQGRFAWALKTVTDLCAGMVDGCRAGEVFSEEVYGRLAETARRTAEVTDNAALRSGLEYFLTLAEPLVGRSFGEIAAEVLGKAPVDSPPAKVVSLEFRYPGAAIVTATERPRYFSSLSDMVSVDSFRSYLETIREMQEAAERLDARAAALGGWIGAPLGDDEPVTGGYRRKYANADLYVANGAGAVAHEVHGEIRRKYDHLHGPDGVLGLPVTDETGTPDGIGRYNHFARDGSIYWTPTTGPMMVRGPVRQVWATHGWERGPLGYPVADEFRLPGIYPQDQPNIAWSQFQNGSVMSQGNAAAETVWGEVSPGALRSLVRSMFDRKLHDAGQDLGLEARVDVVEVSNWGYGFFASVPRRITFKLFGFHENPIIADTTFEITVGLRFATAWSVGFGYPSSMSLYAALDGLSVHADGAWSGQVANGISDGINGAFYRGGPEPGHSEVPNGGVFVADFPTNVNQRGTGGIDLINTLVTAQGGLRVQINPLPPSLGNLRRMFVQTRIDNFLESF